MRRLRIWLGLLCLTAAECTMDVAELALSSATGLRLLSQRFTRWSLIVMPVNTETRNRAVAWWDSLPRSERKTPTQ